MVSDPGEGSPTVATKFDIEDRWPELFVQLDETQRRAVVQSLASAWHEGWTPNREDVENLTDEARAELGISGGTLRLSAGIEDTQDLIEDVLAALDKVQG